MQAVEWATLAEEGGGRLFRYFNDFRGLIEVPVLDLTLDRHWSAQHAQFKLQTMLFLKGGLIFKLSFVHCNLSFIEIQS